MALGTCCGLYGVGGRADPAPRILFQKCPGISVLHIWAQTCTACCSWAGWDHSKMGLNISNAYEMDRSSQTGFQGFCWCLLFELSELGFAFQQQLSLAFQLCSRALTRPLQLAHPITARKEKR